MQVSALSDSKACNAVAVAGVSACLYSAAGGPSAIRSACAAVQLSTDPDTFVAASQCEKAGTPFVGPGSNYSGYASVCRYLPSTSTLCPHSHTDAKGVEIHGGFADCSCPVNSTLVTLSAGNLTTCTPSAVSGTGPSIRTPMYVMCVHSSLFELGLTYGCVSTGWCQCRSCGNLRLHGG